MLELSETVNRKFIDSINVDEWEIETDSGWRPVSAIHKTIEYDVWEIKTEHSSLLAADDHILFDDELGQVFLKDCIPGVTKVMTKFGPSLVKRVTRLEVSPENMYDITVDHRDHRFWSGEFLSHNSTVTCAYILWYIIFNTEKTVALLANKGETAREILGKVQLAYQHLPKWLQQGVVEWNKGSFVLENNSRVLAAATSSSAIRGYSINLLFIDEAAHIDNWEDFFTSVFPTITSGTTSKVVLVSTPNGMNHFYAIWQNAQEGRNEYKPIKVMWYDVPGRDEEWRQRMLAGMNFDTEKFEQEMCCVADTIVTVRDTITGEVKSVSMGDLYCELNTRSCTK